MAARFVVRNSAGVITFDSDVATAGCVVDILDVPANTNQSFTYPLFVGRSAFVMKPDGDREWQFSSDTALGYPRVTCRTYGYGCRGIVVIV